MIIEKQTILFLHLLFHNATLWGANPTTGKWKMNQQKGFSLTEVLVSLLLVTTLALVLLQQQWQSKYMLNQLVIRAQAARYLDQVEESLIAGIKRLPPCPASFHLVLQHKNQEMNIKLAWNGTLDFLIRKHSSIRLQ